ncbi:cytochrome P450 [Streptomyces sp. NPDC054841]
MPPGHYGFEDHTGEQLRVSEVPAIRQAATRRLAGRHNIEIAVWMNSEGYRGTRGAQWNSVTVGRLLRNPIIAGLKAQEDGTLVPTGHPSIIDPDRWLPERAKDVPRGAMVPFSAGSRTCIGDVFGRAETTLTLATIAARWKLRPVPGAEPHTAVPKASHGTGPYPMVPTPRPIPRPAPQHPAEPGRRRAGSAA